MAAGKNATKPVDSEVDETPAKDVAPASSAPAPASGGAPAGVAAPGKKSLNVKEPPQFFWKLVGRSADHILTLFKATEREDADAQLERLTREGYYKDLQILDINAVIKQPPQAKPVANPKSNSRPTAAKSSGAKHGARPPVIAKPRPGAASRAIPKPAKAKATTKSKKQATAKSAKAATPKKPKPKKAAPRRAIKKKK